MSKTRTVKGVGWDVAALGNGNVYFRAMNVQCVLLFGNFMLIFLFKTFIVNKCFSFEENAP